MHTLTSSLLVLSTYLLSFLHPTNAISNGVTVTDASPFPYVAYLQNTGSFFTCDAVLIRHDTVITVQECVQGMSASDIIVNVQYPNGTLYSSVTKSIILQSGFDPYVGDDPLSTVVTNLDSDMAVMILDTPMPSDVELAIYASAVPNTASQEMILLGWGPTTGTDAQLVSPDLAYGVVTRVDKDICAELLAQCGFTLGPQHFCTSTEHSAPAYGDAGGPVIDQTGALVGLISGNPPCAKADNISVNVLLSDPTIYNFIDEHVADYTVR